MVKSSQNPRYSHPRQDFLSFRNVPRPQHCFCISLGENNEYSVRGMRGRLQRLFFFVDYLSLRRVMDVAEITSEIISDYVISISPKHEKSALAIPIKKYITEKQAVGFKFNKGIHMLKSFDSFVYRRGLKEIDLTKQLVMEWTARKLNETVSTQCRRISLLRGLAEYMIRIGYSAYVYPTAASHTSSINISRRQSSATLMRFFRIGFIRIC
jgi:hypothetical protein